MERQNHTITVTVVLTDSTPLQAHILRQELEETAARRDAELDSSTVENEHGIEVDDHGNEVEG